MRLPDYRSIKPQPRHWVALGIAIAVVVATFFILYNRQTQASPTPQPTPTQHAAFLGIGNVNLAPGDSLQVGCPNALSYVASAPGDWTLTCLADTPTATPTETSTDTQTPSPTASDTATSTSTATPTATSTPSAVPTPTCTLAYPFGPTSLPVNLLGASYSGTVASVSANPQAGNYILKVLASARAAHARVLLSMPGGRQNYQNADLSFSLAKLETQFDAYNGIDLSSYIADGTLLAAVAVDEPSDVRGNWGGHAVLDSDLDAAAAYVIGKWPGIRFLIGTHMDYLQARGYAWAHLSGVMEPFTWHNALGNNVIAYMDSEVSKAQAAHLMIVTNINGPDGGTSGGQMTAQQLVDWGTHALGLAYSSGTFIWSWSTPVWPNGGWFTQASIAPAIGQLKALAAARGGC